MSSVSVSSPEAELHFVELWRFGRPEGELRGFHGEGRAAVCVGLTVVLAPASGTSMVDSGSGRCAEHMDIAGQFRVAGLRSWAVGQMDIVVVDEGAGDGDERDIAREAAVVEPVDSQPRECRRPGAWRRRR